MQAAGGGGAREASAWRPWRKGGARKSKHESWEEKERLAALYEQERQRNLADANKVADAMQTLAEEKLQVINTIKALQSKRMKVGKQLRAAKEGSSQSRRWSSRWRSTRTSLAPTRLAPPTAWASRGELERAPAAPPGIEVERGAARA